MITEYYTSGIIKKFFEKEKKVTRQKLISDIIGFGDGMNHIRAAKYFQRTLKKSQESNFKSVYSFRFWHWLVYILLRIVGPLYNRKIYSHLYKLKKHLWVFENYKMEKLHRLYKKYVPYFEEFYKKNNITADVFN